MHKQYICHRDLKPDNVILCKNKMLVKIIDFNVAKNYKNSKLLTKIGLDEWNAPEIIN